MTAPWPYDDVELEPERSTSEPTWECPGGDCECHSVAAEGELFEHSVMLLDEQGESMPRARCRIILRGREINEDAYADPSGWVTFNFDRTIKSVWVEWAPHDTPIEPIYPFRKRLQLDLPDDSDPLEAARRRLGNLGFCQGPTLDDDVAAFQSCFEYEHVNGNIGDILEDLKPYHDEARAPRRGPITPWDGSPDHDLGEDSEDGEDGEDGTDGADGKSNQLGFLPSPKKPQGSSPTPKKPKKPKKPNKGKPPVAPKSKPPKKGGTPKPDPPKKPQSTAAPDAKKLIEVRLRARFWRKGETINRWSSEPHLNQMKKVVASIKGDGITVIGKATAKIAKKPGFVSVTFDMNQPGANKVVGKGLKGRLRLFPHGDHALERKADKLNQLVGPTDLPSGGFVGQCYWRPVEFDIEVDAKGDIEKISSLPQKTVATIVNPKDKSQTALVTNARAARETNNIWLIDWKPDYVTSFVMSEESEHKKPEKPKLKTDAEIGDKTFAIVHATMTAPPKFKPPSGKDFKPETRKRLREIGSVINTCTSMNDEPSPHYIIDDDGFIVKVANEDVLMTHGAGAAGGAAWGKVLARGKSKLKPKSTVPSINALAVGIEHLHEKLSEKDAQAGLTTYTDNQMLSSAWLLRQIDPEFVVSHNQIGIDGANRIGEFKPQCVGRGYKWSLVEREKTFTPQFSFTATDKADIEVIQYIKKEKRLDHNDGTEGGRNDQKKATLTVQKALISIGFWINKPTGRFDETRGALKCFALRCFSGSDRAKRRGAVLDADGDPKAGLELIQCVLATRDACGKRCAP